MKYLLLVAFLYFYFTSCNNGYVASQTFRSEKTVGLSERISQLMDITTRKGLVQLNNHKFKEFVKFPARNYSMLLMFTALQPQRQCPVCSAVHEEFLVAAKSFLFSRGASNKLFFAYLDFDDASDTFHALNINTVPLIGYLPANKRLNRLSDLQLVDMHRSGFTAEAIARFVADKTDIEFKIFRAPNYIGTFALMGLLFLVSLLVYFRQDNLEFLHNRTLWAVAITAFCLTMTSGQMWNHIRGPPFFHRTPTGVSYIHGSSQGQFVVETYLVFALNAGFAACIITLIENKYGRGSGGLSVGVSLVSAVFLFSALLAIFKAKAGGYPYRGLL